MGTPRRRRLRPPTRRGGASPTQRQEDYNTQRALPRPPSAEQAGASCVFLASLLVAAGCRLRPDWPSATCGSCYWAQAGRGEAAAAVMGWIGSDRIGSDRSIDRSIDRSVGGPWRCLTWALAGFSGPACPLRAAEETAGADYQVLRKAKKSIQKLEQTLGSSLKMKECLSLKDENPSSLEEVKEEYVKGHFSNHSIASASEAVSESDSTIWYLIEECEKQTMNEDGKPEFIQSPETSSSDLVEFERYLYFYKHTVDLLIEHAVVGTEEVPLPEVSTAVSHLWQELSEERRDSILQYCSQRDFFVDSKAACQEPVCTEGSERDSRGNSEEPLASSVSTPEEVMFEDAFDVAAGFLDRSKTQGMSSQNSIFSSAFASSPEDHHRLYLQITDFLKSLFFPNTQFCQNHYK
ncbi:LOW QUALITY PROTEIN: stimulated by retinoic acid gene 8 protein homolog [Podargus strigoides]